mmetsp:Transcript_104909/g.234208  ORF Transcript_104909/g.234208 Transcript_104909/m.234208 type:complete len:222 (-) Transcript_104909:469-1134(-)
MSWAVKELFSSSCSHTRLRSPASQAVKASLRKAAAAPGAPANAGTQARAASACRHCPKNTLASARTVNAFTELPWLPPVGTSMALPKPRLPAPRACCSSPPVAAPASAALELAASVSGWSRRAAKRLGPLRPLRLAPAPRLRSLVGPTTVAPCSTPPLDEAAEKPETTKGPATPWSFAELPWTCSAAPASSCWAAAEAPDPSCAGADVVWPKTNTGGAAAI